MPSHSTLHYKSISQLPKRLYCKVVYGSILNIHMMLVTQWFVAMWKHYDTFRMTGCRCLTEQLCRLVRKETLKDRISIGYLTMVINVANEGNFKLEGQTTLLTWNIRHQLSNNVAPHLSRRENASDNALNELFLIVTMFYIRLMIIPMWMTVYLFRNVLPYSKLTIKSVTFFSIQVFLSFWLMFVYLFCRTCQLLWRKRE